MPRKPITDPNDYDYHKVTIDEDRGLRWAAAFLEEHGVAAIEPQAGSAIKSLREVLLTDESSKPGRDERSFAQGIAWTLGLFAEMFCPGVVMKDVLKELDGNGYSLDKLAALGADDYDLEQARKGLDN